mmetsp:Transcript_16122/g.20062  ORF Transcript_16122/g.20062 Transcript_16122/m.20062 type:complete len:405 (-) Transcript_16122:81-1295(-)|eukprot:CAMPEP_0172482250 /NCGR_PEP_ID=MMETSP1066-20121228/8533_1 /TAXON_ID=671091 /ORGANISM="Coscinodiscus wailesii, Strain CCMP2513" /LENGTH=404 /DNA_ID=CAMNT_0013245223 /DNA_START=63 /DNA_END=1277 /DNA_ORIENTATION=-
MGRKKLIVDGKEYANHGINSRTDDGEEDVGPNKCSDWSTSIEGDLPNKVDLRPYMTDVEDQANSNSCCANAVAGAYEYLCKRVAMETGDDIGDISRLFIYYVGRKMDQVIYSEGNVKVKDEGMTLGGAISAMQTKGACLAESYPFELEVVNERPPEETFDEAMDYKVSEAMKVPVDVESMKQCLAEGFPIVFGLKLTEQFFYPLPGGIIRTPDPEDPESAAHGLHAMLIVGYSERQQVFIIRNSWGADWGDCGYAYVPYDYIAGPDFNFLGQYAIKGLTDYDLTPDEDDGEDLPDPNDAEDLDGDGIPDIEHQEDDDEEDEDDDDFDPDDMFDPLAEARRVFAKFDLDGSGYISQDELSLALRRAGIRVSNIEEFFEYFDADGSGQISFNEFCAMCGIEVPEEE